MKYQSIIQILDISDQNCTQQIRKLQKVFENFAISELQKATDIQIQNTVQLNQPLDKNCYNCAHQIPESGANYCINYPKYNTLK